MLTGMCNSPQPPGRTKAHPTAVAHSGGKSRSGQTKRTRAHRRRGAPASCLNARLPSSLRAKNLSTFFRALVLSLSLSPPPPPRCCLSTAAAQRRRRSQPSPKWRSGGPLASVTTSSSALTLTRHLSGSSESHVSRQGQGQCQGGYTTVIWRLRVYNASSPTSRAQQRGVGREALLL